jgi:hypothetical protein
MYCNRELGHDMIFSLSPFIYSLVKLQKIMFILSLDGLA